MGRPRGIWKEEEVKEKLASYDLSPYNTRVSQRIDAGGLMRGEISVIDGGRWRDSSEVSGKPSTSRRGWLSGRNTNISWHQSFLGYQERERGRRGLRTLLSSEMNG